jgi:hypothetical protein
MLRCSKVKLPDRKYRTHGTNREILLEGLATNCLELKGLADRTRRSQKLSESAMALALSLALSLHKLMVKIKVVDELYAVFIKPTNVQTRAS